MMMSEFVERTGFEPTEDEYREIERQYMACGKDKDEFCKNWLKNDGAQKLMGDRAIKIETLERELAKQKEEYESNINDLMLGSKNLAWQLNDYKDKINKLTAKCEQLERENRETLQKKLHKKLVEEQTIYENRLLSGKPEEIFHHAYTYNLRQDILCAMEYVELSGEQAAKLLASETPLADICNKFDEYADQDTHMEMIGMALQNA